MTRKLLKGTLLLTVFTVATWAGLFYWHNLRGVMPAFFGAANDAGILVGGGKAPLSYPPEFALTLFADGLPGARVMAFDPRGAMLVSMPAAGKVVALPDADNNGRADRVVDVVTGLNRPHGLAFSSDPAPRLYIAEKDRVAAYDYDPAKMRVGAGQKICDLPAGGGMPPGPSFSCRRPTRTNSSFRWAPHATPVARKTGGGRKFWSSTRMADNCKPLPPGCVTRFSCESIPPPAKYGPRRWGAIISATTGPRMRST
jgi:hypothetical protein